MKKVFMNGNFYEQDELKLSITDRGYQFGDGVYEVIRYYNKKLFKLDEHLERYKKSAEKIDVPFPYPLEKLSKDFQKLIDDLGSESGYIYTQLTRGVMDRNHIYIDHDDLEPTLIAYPVTVKERPIKTIEDGIKVLLEEDFRWLKCDIKSLNLLGSVMAKNKAHSHGAKEAVLHRDGIITEGSSTNVFVIKDGKLYTHPANHLILNGITRLTVLDIVNQQGIPVHEVPFSVEFFKEADEAFTTSTTAEITPIVEYVQEQNGKLTTKPIGEGKSGPMTKDIQRKFEKVII